MTTGPLSGITIIDMTEGVAGPYASMLLGDMGANVIKVERPEGDWSRTAGQGDIAKVGGGQFVALNRNKRDIGLDIGRANGRQIIERLVSRADVLISNYRAGVMAKLGLDYAHCRSLKGDLIYCTVSGFGQEGTYAQFPASDTIMQAMSGVMSMVGEADGPPLRVGFPLIDITAANHAVQAVLVALYARLSRRLTGEPASLASGAQIDISLMAAALSLMNGSFTEYLATGRLPQRQGNQNATLAPAGAFQVADGDYITIAVLRDSHWQKFCVAMNLGALANDERFHTNARRVQNRAALDAIIVPMLAAKPAAYWLERLRAADILCGPINTFAGIDADAALMSALPMIDPMLPEVPRMMGTPIKFDGRPFPAVRAPPAKGQHTREVLAEFGFEPGEIADFLASGSAFVSVSP